MADPALPVMLPVMVEEKMLLPLKVFESPRRVDEADDGQLPLQVPPRHNQLVVIPVEESRGRVEVAVVLVAVIEATWGVEVEVRLPEASVPTSMLPESPRLSEPDIVRFWTERF